MFLTTEMTSWVEKWTNYITDLSVPDHRYSKWITMHSRESGNGITFKIAYYKCKNKGIHCLCHEAMFF